MNNEDRTPNLLLAKKLNIIAYIVSALVIGLVVVMRKIKIDSTIDFSFLPPLHSLFNAIAAAVLILAFMAIRQKNVDLHRKAIYVAFGFSTLFLVSYVVYHLTTPPTLYCGHGAMRYIYFFLLITHVVLAAIIFPFILFTLILAYTGQISKHRNMARWVFPIWLYVAITGPICYLFLLPCY